jgi:hypothetical protein
MSFEVFGDGDDGDTGITEDRAQEMAINAAQVMREMLARFVEVDSPTIAQSIRANWIPDWGADPGKWEGPIPTDIWQL